MSTGVNNRDQAMSLIKMTGITHAPIDVEKVAQRLGFTIIEADFPDNYSGEIFIEGNVKSIGINKNHNSSRKRFSIAHELGHYLNAHQNFDDGGEMLDDINFDFTNPIHRQEKEANMFAAELLMPKDFLIKDLNEFGLDINKLKEKYDVSEQSMWIRLTSLRLAEKYSK
ncbi:MAG: ImmA/IrrE family metallo-endopeptidase [Patescibacteria group bacterium]